MSWVSSEPGAIGAGMRSITALQAVLGRGGFTAAVVLCVVVLLLMIATLRRRGAHRVAEGLAFALLLVAVGGVLAMTLIGPLPAPFAEPRLFVDPVAGARGWYGIAWRPVFDNVVLFVPVGAFAATAAPRRPFRAVLLGCLALSLGVETFQYLVPSGRVANAADVLANVVGAVIGAGLASLLRARRAGGRHAERIRSSARG